MGDRVKEGGPTTTETDKARLGKTVVCTRGNGVLAGMEAQVASEGLAELGGFLGVTLALTRWPIKVACQPTGWGCIASGAAFLVGRTVYILLLPVDFFLFSPGAGGGVVVGSVALSKCKV